MTDLPHILGIASIRNLYKTYKSFIKKWHSKRKSSNHDNDDASQLEDRFDHISHLTIEEVGDHDDKQGRKTMSGVDSFRQNGEGMGENEPKSPNKGQFKDRNGDSGLFSMPSLSRSASRRNHTAKPSSLFRSMSRKSVESRSSPASNGRKSMESMPSPPPFLAKCVSRRNSTPIMYSNSSGMLKAAAIEKKLECTLEELCFGCMKKIKITRDVLTKTGETIKEEELLTIKVKPGWKKGTKITFEGMGNERAGAHPADIIFIITEKKHSLFRREGDDLELAVEIPLVKALTGCTVSVPLLGGDKLSLTVDEEIIYHGYEKRIEGQGMAISKEQGKMRGCLKVTFLVEFPTQLTDEQRSDILRILQDS